MIVGYGSLMSYSVTEEFFPAWRSALLVPNRFLLPQCPRDAWEGV